MTRHFEEEKEEDDKKKRIKTNGGYRRIHQHNYPGLSVNSEVGSVSHCTTAGIDSALMNLDAIVIMLSRAEMLF